MRIAGSGSVAWPSEALGRDEFVELVRREGARLHRDLPWRYIDDPYAVLVSEVMLPVSYTHLTLPTNSRV